MLVVLIIFTLNLLWAVINWKNELDFIYAIYTYRGISFNLLTAPFFLIADIVITGTATSIFGFGGFYGSAMAILLSNLLSVFFFTPKGDNKELIKRYRNYKKYSEGKGENLDVLG